MDSQSPRDRILEYIRSYPGNHFRAIQRDLKLSLGVLQYHISVLKKQGQIIEVPINGFNCYFPQNMFNKDLLILFGHLRNKTRKKILVLLLDGKARNLNEIKESLKLSLSTIFYHMGILVKDNVVSKIEDNGDIKYSIENPDYVKKVLIQYKYSFVDKLLRDLISIWEK